LDDDEGGIGRIVAERPFEAGRRPQHR
jgi:hypothetical protein